MGETVGSVPGHFREVAISLHYLLNHEDFTDLTFLCSDGPVHCHKAMLLTHSPLLKYLFSISAARQASDTTVISLPHVEKIVMIKLLQYVYKGKASFKKDQDLGKLYELAEVLDFDMSFAKKDSEDDNPRQTVVTSKTKKKKDANKKKQTELNEAAKEVPDEDLASALIKKFQAQAQNQNDPAPVTQVLEESPIIVTGKRKRVAQTLEEKKGKKYQYYTGNKVSRYQDGSDDDGVAAGQEKDSEDVGAIVNVIESDEGLAMDVDEEECTKQRAALDKMKIGLKNCGSEENVKQKVIEILEGDKSVQPEDVGEKDGDAGASVSQEVTIDPNLSPKEICNKVVVGKRESSVGKGNQAPQVNLERKSPRSKKEVQMKESVEGVGDNQLEENAKGVSDKSVVNETIDVVGDVEINVDKSVCTVSNDIGKAASSVGDVMENDIGSEQGDLIEMDTSNELDVNGDQNLKEVTDGDTEIMEMPLNVEKQSKQKAALDNMKVNILNCAKEEHIKEKVKALMIDIEKVDSKQNDSEIGDLPTPTESDPLDTEIFVEEIVKPLKKRGRPAKASMSDIGKDDTKQNDSEIGDFPSPTESDPLDTEIFVEEIVKPLKKRGRPANITNKLTNFEKIPDSNEGHGAAIIDSTITPEVSLVQSDEEVENPLEEWEAKAMMDKMKIKIHKLDKDPIVRKVYSKSEIQKMVQQVLKNSDDEEVNAKKMKVVTDEDSPPDGSGEDDCDRMSSPRKAQPVKSSPIKISSDIQLASRTQICAFCRRIFLSIEAFHNHIKEEHGHGAQICAFCRRIFLSIEAFDNHIKEEHGHGEDDADDELDDIVNADDSPSKKIIKKRMGSKVSKSESKRKNKVKSYSEETSDESGHSEDGKKRIATKPKDSDDSFETDDNKEKKKRLKRKKSSSSEEMANQSKIKTGKPTGSNGVENAISCYKCGIECKTKQDLKNHILTHFYSELFVFLPASKPFTCPTCSALNRDRTTLVRHYAFTHKEIYKYCTEEQLNGGSSKGKRKSVNYESSSGKLDDMEGAKSNGFNQSMDHESLGLSAKKNSADFDIVNENITFTDSDDEDLFASRKDTNYTVKSFDDLFNETQNASKTKSVSNGGHDVSDPSDNMSEKFLGMDDNDPADVDDLLKESDDGN